MIVDALRSLGIDYTAAGPLDARARASLDSAYLIECCHDEFAVAMAHGFAKIAGRPMAAMLLTPAAVKHASMAIFNAFADRVPLLVLATKHAGTADPFAPVRGFLRGSVEAATPHEFPVAVRRARQWALASPMGPVAIAFDPSIAESTLVPQARLPLPIVYPPQGDAGAVGEAAQWLTSAARPWICAERAARDAEGLRLIVELAELLGAPVSSWERMNFPNRHPLAGSGGPDYDPDLMLALDVRDPAALAHRPGRKVIHISPMLLDVDRNYQTQGRESGAIHLNIAGDAQATLPALIEACRRRMNRSSIEAAAQRQRRLAAIHQAAQRAQWEAARQGWNAQPIALPRLCAEIWPLLETEDWSLVSWTGFLAGWPQRLWNFDRHYRYIGGQGAGGLGYGAPAAAGAALANREHGRTSISIQTDGDFLYGPTILSTVARYRIPLLTVMHNNRSYQAEVAPLQRQASLLNRDPERARIGTVLDDPAVDFARLARSMGMFAEGPISDPEQLRPALQRGLERVKAGEPVLIDVLTQRV